MAEAERAQVERLREWPDGSDHYGPIAGFFASDPLRADDPELDALRAMSRPDATWLDIGAGGGRYALPLALVSRKVIAVEPSEGMRDVLTDGMRTHGIENIDLLPLRWPDGAGEVEVDFGLIAHVGYDIHDINPFLDALEAASRERCVALLMDRAPSSGFGKLWKQVHGEERRELPALREFLHLLLARGALPEVRHFPRTTPLASEDRIRWFARRRLWLEEGSEKDRHLQALLDEVAFDDASGPDFGFPTLVGMVSWTPAGRG
jgi:hypothetical protein